MKIYLTDLQEKKVQKLIINSLEQALYQAIVVIDDTEHIVWEKEKVTLIRRNLTGLRQIFEPFNVPLTVLRHESIYDEMIGMDSNAINNRLEVPLGNNPYSEPKWLH